MATKTENYHLEKPEEDDFYRIGTQNENIDKIDLELNKVKSSITSMPQEEILEKIDNKIGSSKDYENQGSIFAKLNGLIQWFTSTWTANRAAKLDSISAIESNLTGLSSNLGTKASIANVSGDAIARIANAHKNAEDVSAKIGIVGNYTNRKPFKSVQYGTFRIEPQETEKTYYFSPVDINKCLITFQGDYSGNAFVTAFTNNSFSFFFRTKMGGTASYRIVEFY